MSDKKMENGQKTKGTRKARYYYFAMILYVDEDIRHQKVYDYIKDAYSYACIIHDKDIDAEGELKKKHMHLVYKSGSQSSTKSQLDAFGGYISHIEGVNNILSYYKYLTHTDFKSMVDEKHQYKLSDIQGDLQVSPNAKNESGCKSLISFIDTATIKLTMMDLVDYAMTISDDLISEIKIRNMFYYNLLKEHNEYFDMISFTICSGKEKDE